MDKSLQELVNAYCDEPTQGLRHAIITEAIPLVKSIIGKISRPDTPLSQYEDLESAGVMGLLQALDNYDCSKDIQFNTFAYYRIRGNIIDYLRSIDELPRTARKTYGEAQEVMRRLQQELGRQPEDEEVAAEMGISLEEFHKLLSSVQQRAVLSLDQQVFEDSEGSTLSSTIEDEQVEQPDAELNRKSMSKELEMAIKELKERERLILSLYYYEDLTLNEIAVLLGLTEARISQIVGKLLLSLRSSLVGESVNRP
ncbi:FliA/WhiG family RNA polymerase sigma factor [Fodinibius sediminis]|uniref:RNA polymerase, sigma 28 subunit, SigD/FliA/WhiG n=1 Tax=Fodinibius sediminis TaxID=1214077 RepID=A0A521CI55_9BACT|nr:FliA/WhiG family RNA polymerase sigma factor [Fodinibius sediminis]SMO59114.1 RNA polymerase, sigma 28 subunit, SigD/FliA/WhiG [Fodinibius sediminis]